MERQNRPRADQVDLVLNILTIKKPLSGIGGQTARLAQRMRMRLLRGISGQSSLTS